MGFGIHPTGGWEWDFWTINSMLIKMGTLNLPPNKGWTNPQIPCRFHHLIFCFLSPLNLGCFLWMFFFVGCSGDFFDFEKFSFVWWVVFAEWSCLFSFHFGLHPLTGYTLTLSWCLFVTHQWTVIIHRAIRGHSFVVSSLENALDPTRSVSWFGSPRGSGHS